MKTVESVLIVEDNPIDVFINTRVIEQTGIAGKVIVQASAANALLYIKSTAVEELPKLIFLDIRMPDMDGFEFLEIFETLSAEIQEASRIVILSSSLSPYDLERSQNSRLVMAFIPKPLTREKLLALSPQLA